jgi:hypothetical protein
MPERVRPALRTSTKEGRFTMAIQRIDKLLRPGYFARGGTAVMEPSGLARMPSMPIWPPDGVWNSTLPRIPAVSVYWVSMNASCARPPREIAAESKMAPESSRTTTGIVAAVVETFVTAMPVVKPEV